MPVEKKRKEQRPTMDDKIYRLYSRPSFFEGVARLFDFGGTLNHYNYSRSEREADFRAIESDWQAIGEDLRTALIEFVVNHPLEN